MSVGRGRGRNRSRGRGRVDLRTIKQIFAACKANEITAGKRID